MAILFGQILNMSLSASVIILCVMAVRLALKKAPKIYSYALWSVVLFRLLCPVSLASDFSVLELTQPEVSQSEAVSYVSYAPVEQVLIESGDISPKVQPDPIPVSQLQPVQQEKKPTVMEIVSYIWLAGMAVMLLNSAVTYLRLYRNLTGAMQWQGNVYLADRITSPFVLGTLFPKIYLPSDTPMEERRYIIAHERHHIRRGDHIIKLLAYAALCIHWFNPLVWVSFLLAGKDMEMSCDEAVIKKLGEHIRADYAESLLRLATHKKIISGTPLAFGEGDTKGRVLNMAKWKRPRVWGSVLCVVLCILVVTVCALNPDEDKSLKELTLNTGENGPCDCASSDFNYILPAGVAHWLEDRADFSDEEMKNILTGQENRSSTEKYFAIGDEVFGGLQDHILPEGTDLTDPQSWMEHLDLWEWKEENLGYFGSSSLQADWELEFFTDVPPDTEIKPVQRKHYFFLSTYGHRVFDLWFDMTVADPAIADEIIRSAYVREESVGTGKYKLEAPATLRLGGFQITVPAGCGYIRTGDTKLEFVAQGYWSGITTLGGVDVYKTPDFAIETSEDLVRWVKALGVTWDETRESYAVTDETEYGDISLSVDDLHNGKAVLDTQHYFYIHGDNVYHIWFDELEIDDKKEKEILDSITLWDISGGIHPFTGPATAGTIPSGYSIQIGQFPEGYTYETDGYGNVLFLDASDTIGGLTSYAIPEGVYDPDKGISHWIQNVGIPDYEDLSLQYLGGMSFFEDEWGASFASNVPEGVEPSVYRKHSFHMIGDRVFDYWFDLLRTDWDTAMDIRDAVKIIDNTESSPMEQVNKCRAVLKAVQSGSSHISLERRYDANTGPADYTQEYLRHQNQNHDEWLSTITVQIAGMAEKHANLYADGTYFSNMGKWNEDGLIWTEMMTNPNPLRPWLTSYQWQETTVTYIDTLPDGSGECIMLRIDEPYVTRTEQSQEHYFVNFYFDSEGSFVRAEITVDLYTEDEFTQTESIVTLNNLTVFNAINKEYKNAAGKSLIEQTVQ